jgi:hypothetical protein
VNSNPADIIADDLAFASMEPGTDFNPERSDILSNCMGALNPTRRSVKGGEKSVPGRFDLMAAKSEEISTCLL